MSLSEKQRFIFLSISILTLFFILISMVPPSVYSGDCGETITASYTLGIQHPPGYPTFSLIAKLFTYIPIGDISYRIYLFTITVSILCFLLIHIFFKKFLIILNIPDLNFLSFYPSFIFITGFTVLQQSIIAKGGIYILNLFFLILFSILLLDIYTQGKNKKNLFLFCLLFGLSLGNHLMLQLVLTPAYIYIIYKSEILKNLKKNDYIISLLFFILGAFIYIYLPIRAKIAILNWGDPSTFSNFFEVITRYQYIRSEITRSFSSTFFQALKFFVSSIYENIFIGFIFIVFGCVFIYKSNKNLFWFLILIPILFLLITSFYLNLKKDHLYIMETYITPIYFSFSILFALGIHYIFSILKIYKFMLYIFFVIFLLQTCIFYKILNINNFFIAYDYNKNILSSVERNAILFMSGDGVVFPAWYLKYVKNYRPDVTIIGTPVLPMKWVRDNAIRQNPEIRMPVVKQKIGTESTGYLINAIIKLNIARFNIYFSYNKPEENAIDSDLKIMPKGMVQKVLPNEYAFVSDKYIVTNANMWKFYNLRGIYYWQKKFSPQDTINLYAKDMSVAANSSGTFFEDNMLYDWSLYYFKLAHKLFPSDHEYVYNIGNAYYNLEKYDMALIQYKKCIEMNPNYENGWYNLGVTYYTLKDYKQAIHSFEMVKKINPQRTDVDQNIRALKMFYGNSN
jgi:tetratricopeptide (TPR) repeat protein